MITFKQWLANECGGGGGGGGGGGMAGTGPYIGGCVGGPDYQVWGACSDFKKKKKRHKKEEQNERFLF